VGKAGQTNAAKQPALAPPARGSAKRRSHEHQRQQESSSSSEEQTRPPPPPKRRRSLRKSKEEQSASSAATKSQHEAAKGAECGRLLGQVPRDEHFRAVAEDSGEAADVEDANEVSQDTEMYNKLLSCSFS